MREAAMEDAYETVGESADSRKTGAEARGEHLRKFGFSQRQADTAVKTIVIDVKRQHHVWRRCLRRQREKQAGGGFAYWVLVIDSSQCDQCRALRCGHAG